MNTQQKNTRFIYLAIFAVLTFFVGGRWNFPLAAWLAPIFSIRFYRHSEKGGRAYLWLWLAMAVPIILGWKGATALSLMHPVAEIAFFALLTPITLIPHAVDRFYYRRWGNPFWLSLVYPIAAAAMDFFSSSGSPFGTFGAGAYFQVGVSALMQTAAIVGLWGIPFIVGWFASFINYAWENDFRWTKIRIGTWIYAGLLILIFSFGLSRILSAPAPKQDVLIAGFSLPEEELMSMMELWQQGEETQFRASIEELHNAQLGQVRKMAQDGAQIVVLQEGAGMGFPEQVDVLLEKAAIVAKEENIYLVLPTVAFDPTGAEPAHNVVRIIDPTGEIVLEHYKYGGTQFEGSVAGDGEIQTVDTPYGTLSAIICWDADFPLNVKAAGEKGVDLLFVPSNDWYEVRDIHAGMASFRAVENGMSIFRQTGAGVSSVVDARGRIVNRIDIFEEEKAGRWGGEQMVIAPVGSVETLYSKLGDAFGQVMQIALLLLIAFAWLKRNK